MKKKCNKASDTFIQRFQGKCSLIPLSGISTIVNDQNSSTVNTSNYTGYTNEFSPDRKLLNNNNRSIFSKNFSEYYNTTNRYHRKFYDKDTKVIDQLSAIKTEKKGSMDITEIDRKKWLDFKGLEYNFNSQEKIDLSKSKTVEFYPKKETHREYVNSKNFFKKGNSSLTNKYNELEKKFVDQKLNDFKNKKTINKSLPRLNKISSDFMTRKTPNTDIKRNSIFDYDQKRHPSPLKLQSQLKLAKSASTLDDLNKKVQDFLLNENRNSLPKLDIDPQYHLKKNSSRIKTDNFVKNMNSDTYKFEYNSSKKQQNDLNQKIIDMKYNKVNTGNKR